MKTKVGFVGCGGIAEAHLNAMNNFSDVEFTAFCDIDEQRGNIIAEKYKGKYFIDAKDMIENVDLDCIFFCLPPFAHGAEIYAIEKNIPFAVEKPVGLDLSLCKEILSGIKEKDLLTCVLYMNRYRRGIKMVKELSEKSQPILILGGWIGGTPKDVSSGIWKWWIQKDKSGGQFHEQVTHTVNLAKFFCGDAESVHAFAVKGKNKNAPLNYSIEDAVVVNIKFKNGTVANLWASCSANAGGGGVSLDVYSNDFTAKFTGWDHTLKLYRKDQDTIEVRGEPNIFEIEDRAFIDAVKTKNKSLIMSDYEDGFKTIQITLAADISMKKGEVVFIE
ncbi:MAG: Gfo/Idh/MocA family oxidoreductase [bacterium]|nr:Gfo/Idh/MocA family oxidoreductase [bacterium]